MLSCCCFEQPEIIRNNVNSDDLDIYSVGLFFPVHTTSPLYKAIHKHSDTKNPIYTGDRVTVWRLYILEKTACDVKVWHPKLKSSQVI